MPSRLRQRTQTFFSRFRPVEHVPVISHNNVHDLSRVGGVSVLTLPEGCSPCDLVVPTRFAATAQFLVDFGSTSASSQNGNMTFAASGHDDYGYARESCERAASSAGKINLPGLFRIPGSKVTTERLRTYFERQMYDGGGTVEDAIRRSHDIEYTVRLPLLPNPSVIPYQIHDVASCFKSFLADLEGGILGRLVIFEGLRKVVLPQRPRKSSDSADLDWRCRGASEYEPIDPKHIARILCSIECAASRNLIMAVFGLLAVFMIDDSPEHLYEQRMDSGVPGLEELRENCFPLPPADTRMTAEALGRIFAPLMLSEEAVQNIKMDFGKPDRKGKERHPRSWTSSPLKCVNIGVSPTKRTNPSARPRPRSAFAGNKVNFTINIHHPHPLRSSPYLPLREMASRSPSDVQNRPLSKAEQASRVYGASLDVSGSSHDSAHSFVRAHANCSMPNLVIATNGQRSRATMVKKPSSLFQKSKDKEEAKTTALIHDQQARMLLIANVITLVLWNWKDVVADLQRLGYGRNEGRWFVSGSDTA